jgi:hypothetical protein
MRKTDSKMRKTDTFEVKWYHNKVHVKKTIKREDLLSDKKKAVEI